MTIGNLVNSLTAEHLKLLCNLMNTLYKLTFILTTSIIIACGGSGSKVEIPKTTINSINLDTLPELKRIVDSIAKGNSVESSHIGEAGSPSEQYAKYEQLKSIATIKQLTMLTDHQNSAVRCYAFQALATNKADNVFNVLLNHLNDTSSVYTLSGCVGGNSFTGDYFIDVVTPNYIDTQLYKLSPNERQTLDSILLYDKSIKLSAKSGLLEKLKPTPENYDRIKELVTIERNESALRVLGKYRKQSDKELIASFFKDEKSQLSALYAVREFPDDYFYPYVKNVFEQEWKQKLYDYGKWRICYQALAKFPKPETLELFDRTTKSKDEFRHETLCSFLLIAITKYPNKLYVPIRAKIRLQDFMMEEVKEELENDY